MTPIDFQSEENRWADLAERCEQAIEGDRDLDADIAAMFGKVTWKQANYTMEQYAAIEWSAPHPYAGMKEPVYKYTTLMDDAKTLVPDHMVFNLGNDVKCWAHIWHDLPEYDGVPFESARCSNLALAISAASCRAHAHLAALKERGV